MAGFLEAGDGAKLGDAALDVGMAGLPVVGDGAIASQHRVGVEQAGRLDVDDEGRAGMQAGDVAREHDADLVGENLVAFIVDHAAAVAVAVEAQPDIGAGFQHLVADGMQHLHVFGIGVVARKSVVEFDVERDHLAADALQRLRREGAGGAVAAGGHHLQLARDALVPQSDRRDRFRGNPETNS